MKDQYRRDGTFEPDPNRNSSPRAADLRESDLAERMRRISEKYLPQKGRTVTSMHTVAAEMFSEKRNSVVEICSDQEYVFGTGFLLSDRRIATNAHVVFTMENDRLQLLPNLRVRHLGRLYRAHVVNYDVKEDLALLTFTDHAPDDLDRLANRLGSSHQLLAGDEVITVGAALGYGLTYNKFSVKDRVKHRTEAAFSCYREVLLLNGTAQHGNSGGPLYNINGEVVGILTGSPNTFERVTLELPDREPVSATMLSPEAGICFAVPSETLRAFLA